MVSAYCSAINFALPICVGFTQSIDSSATFSVHVGYKLTEFVTVHYVDCLFLSADRYVTAIVDCRLRTTLTLLSSDNDNTVRTTRTVDSSSRSILQYSECFDIVRVNHRKRVRQTLYTAVVHCQTVNYDQWVIGCIQGRTTTDTDLCTCTRSTAGRSYVHTGNLTLHHVLCIGHKTFVHFVRFHGCHRTCQVVLLGYTVTDNYDFTQHF